MYVMVRGAESNVTGDSYTCQVQGEQLVPWSHKAVRREAESFCCPSGCPDGLGCLRSLLCAVEIASAGEEGYAPNLHVVATTQQSSAMFGVAAKQLWWCRPNVQAGHLAPSLLGSGGLPACLQHRSSHTIAL